MIFYKKVYIPKHTFLTAKEAAKFNIKSIDGRIVSLRDQIRQIEAVVSGLNQRLARYSIKSPASGYVTKKEYS